MPTYSLTSPKTGRTYRVNFSQEPEESDMEEAVDAFDAEEPVEAQPQEASASIDPTQGQLGTLGASLARGFATIPSSLASAVVDTQRTVGDIAEKYTGPLGRQVAMSLTGGEALNTQARDFLDIYQGNVEEAYPINPENEVANVIGQAIPQAAGMLVGGGIGAGLAKTAAGAKAAMRTVPLVMGGLLGTGQGIQQAEELGVEEPESRLAMGLLTGGIEAAIESIGGIGGKASKELIEGARKKASELITDAFKSIAGEAFEEGVTTPAQNLVATAFANEDPNNPGFTKTGVELPNVDPTTKEFWKEIGLSMIGGAAGGTLFAGLNVASNLAKPDADPFAPEAQITEDDTSAEDMTLDDAIEQEAALRGQGPTKEEMAEWRAASPDTIAEVTQRLQAAMDSRKQAARSDDAMNQAKVSVANAESYETLGALAEIEGRLNERMAERKANKDAIAAAESIQAAQKQAAETQTQETKTNEESILLQQQADDETQTRDGQAPDGQGQEEVITESQVAEELDPFESPLPETRISKAIQQKPDGKTSGPRVTDLDANRDYSNNGGWKLHLSVSPENYRKVDEWLHENHKGQYKLLSGGSPEEGSDFTVYVGDRDAADGLAGKIESEIGDALNDFAGGKDAVFNKKVGGRFDVSRTGNIKDVPWEFPGALGIPLDEKSLNDILFSGDVPRTRDEYIAKAKPYLDRIDSELAKKYGSRYTGTKKQTLPANVPPATSPVDTTGTQDPFEDAPTQGEEVSTQREAVVTAPGGTVAPESQQEVTGEQRLVAGFTGIESPAVAADIKAITDFEASEPSQGRLLTISGTTLTPSEADKLSNERLEDYIRGGVESIVAYERQPSVTPLEKAQEAGTRLSITSAMMTAQGRGMDVKGIMEDERRKRQETTPAIQDSVPSVIQAADTEQASQISFNEADVINLKQIAGFTNNELRKRLSALRLFMQGKIESGAFISPESMENVARLYTEARKRGLLESEPSIDDYIERRDKTKPSPQPPTQETQKRDAGTKKDKPKTIEEADARIASQQMASEFLSEMRAEAELEQQRKKRTDFIQASAQSNQERAFLNDLTSGGWDKAMNDVAGNRVSPVRASELALMARDNGLIDDFTAARFTPPPETKQPSITPPGQGTSDEGSGIKPPASKQPPKQDLPIQAKVDTKESPKTDTKSTEQKRAAIGGEYGPNGEWYPGGAFIATTDMPKKVKEKITRAAKGTEQVEPGYGGDKRQVIPAGKLPIVARIMGTFIGPDGVVNESYIDRNGFDKETADQVREAAKRYRDGERLLDVTEFPLLANFTDAARLIDAGLPIPGDLLGKMPEDVRDNLIKASTVSNPTTEQKTIKQGDTIQFKQDNKILSGKYLGPITVGGATTYQIQVAGESKPRRVSAKSINDSNDAKLEGTMFSRISDTQQQSPESKRHAELEAKYNAGTITAAETQEAERLVAEAARKGGYAIKAYHKTWETFNEFILGGNLQETKQWFGKNGKIRTLIGQSGKGFFFSLDRDNTPAYHNQKKTGERVLEVYLKYKNPLVFDKDTKDWAIDVFGDENKEFPRIITNEAYDLVKQDYDSIELYNKGYNNEANPDEVIVLDPNQIKSADPFTGVPLDQRFNPESPDIRYSRVTGEQGSVRDHLEKHKLVTDKDVLSLLGDYPSYLDEVAAFILRQREKWMSGSLTARDVAKAYAITVASQGADAMNLSVIQQTFPDFNPGPEFTSTGAKGQVKIRPEEAAAYWFSTPTGKRALDSVEAVDIDIEAWNELSALRKLYGDDRMGNTGVTVDETGVLAPLYERNADKSTILDKDGNPIPKLDENGNPKFRRIALNPKTQANLRNIQEIVNAINAAKGDWTVMEEALMKLRGIGGAKKAFIGHLLGFGGDITTDAVEINYWITGRGDTSQLGRGKDKSKVQLSKERFLNDLAKAVAKDATAVEDLSGRIKKSFQRLRKKNPDVANIPEEIFNHIMHHWLWDRAKGIETTHKGMMKAVEMFSRQRTTRTKTQGLERSVAEKHLKKLGVPSSKVYLVDEPSFKWRGRYDPDGSIGINIAYLNSIDELNDTLFDHEAIHDAVETDRKVKQRAIELLDSLTKDELSIINEQIKGYAENEKQDERIVEAVRLMTSRRPDLRTKWARFVEAVTLAIKKFLGIKNLDRQVAELTAARILARGRDRVMRGKMGGRDKFSGNMYAGDAVTEAKDAEYLAAVEAGDMSKAQRMVDEAASAAGYDARKFYHGTPTGGFTEFRKDYQGRTGGRARGGFSFTTNKDAAEAYATGFSSKSVALDESIRIANKALSDIDGKPGSMEPFINQGYEEDDGLPEFYWGAIDDNSEFSEFLKEIAAGYDKTFPKTASLLRQAASAATSFEGKAEVFTVFLKIPPDSPQFKATPETLGSVVASLDVRNEATGAAIVNMPNQEAVAYVAEPSQIKSADPVTYDSSGNVIPLSQRFQPESPDIRYSRVNDSIPTQGEPTATESQLRGIAERTKIEQDIAEASGGKKPKRKRVFGVDDAGRIYTPEDMETAKQAAKGVFDGETMTLDAAGKAQWERTMEQYSVSTPGSGGRVLSLIESGNEMAPTALQTELGIFAERYTDLTKDPTIFKQFVNEVNDLLSVIGGITSAARAMAARRWSPLTERWGAYLKVNKEIKKNGPPDVDEISDDSADEANEEMTDALDDNPDETAAIEAMDQAEATAERIMARVAEQYADAPTAEKAKKGQDPLRALYRELLDGKLTQEQFTTRATQILAGVDEAKLKELYEAETLNEKDATKKLEADWASGVAERLWNAGSMERDAAAQLKAAKDAESAAKKQERREAAEQAKIDAANNRASQLLFEVEKRMRQSGITPMTEAQKDTFRKAFQDQVRKPVSFDAFFRRIEALNINEDVANRAFRTAARERLDVERMAVFKKKQALLEQDSKALAKLLNQVKGDVKWSDFFTNNSRISQKERQRRIYVQILKNDYLRNLSQAERLQLTRELDKAWARARKKVFISEFSKKIPLKNPKLKKQLAAQAPALLKAINLGTFNSQAYRKEIAKTYGLKDLSDADLVKVIKLGAEIQEARGESLAQRKKIEELANLVSGVTNIPRSHILASYYISSILASGRTGVGAMFSILEVAIEAVVGVTMTTWKSPTQAMAGLNAVFKAFPRGVLEGLSHFRTGDKTGTLLATDSFNQWLKGDGYSPISIGELLWREKNPVKKFAGLVIMASERMLSGIDLTLSSTLHEAALVWANSITEFKDSKGNTVSLRNPTAADKVRMRQQVIAEWFGGVEPPRSLENIAKINAGMRDQIERFYIDEDPSAGLELVKGARRTASGPSFQGEVTSGVGFLIKRLNGVFADTGEAFEKYAEKNKIGPVERYIAGLGVGAFALAKSFVGLQFVSFIGKLINRNLQFVPGSALVPRWIYGDNVSQYEKGSIRVKNAMGLALISLALAYIMGDDDDEEATLGLEGDWASLSGEQRDAKRTAKAIPSSIWFRDENGQKVYISFANSSLSWIFTSVANLREIKVNNPEKWKETSDAAIAAEGIVGAINSVFNTSATGRLAELLGGSPFSKSTPGAGAEKVARIGTTFAGGFIPSVIREMDFMLDPSYYEPKTLAERAVSVIPFLRRQVADSQGSLGVLGTPAQINRSPTSRVYSSGADTEAEKILARMADEGLYLPLPDDKAGKDYVSPVSGRKIPMTPAQVREYVKLTGESYQSFILREGERLMTMDRDKAKDRISDAASNIKKRAARMAMRIQE